MSEKQTDPFSENAYRQLLQDLDDAQALANQDAVHPATPIPLWLPIGIVLGIAAISYYIHKH